jgi:alkanesulfonate monooxygenase SsuD/methylene tetrahydromethanopterin reductase-like flavin-dependent oxidoreductase (luciferase family)
MEFYAFHLMPWPHLAADYREKHNSAWVTFSNAFYDPKEGHALYTRYIDELVFSEQSGFDGVCVNEHHQNAYGTMPSPNVIAAMLVQRTSHVKIAILGNALPLREHPLRVAEEVAMLDVISGGRIISGFVRGIGAEYHSFGLNPAYSRERFLEAHDLIVKAWTEPGPFAWTGKHYNLRYVNPWPRPMQKPHPPIWIPSMGSGETIDWAAERRYPYLQTYTPVAQIKPFFDQYRRTAEANGYTASPAQFGWAVPTYVGESDTLAREEAWPHLDLFNNDLLRMPQEFLFPPNYLTEQSMARVMGAKSLLGVRKTFEDVDSTGLAIVGSPDTVLRRIEEAHDLLGFGLLVPFLQFGSLPADLTRRNIERFAEFIMPRLRGR